MKNFFSLFHILRANPLYVVPPHSISTAYFAITLLRPPFSNFVGLQRKLCLQKQHHLGQRVDLCACLSYLLLTPLGINLAVDGPSALHYIKYQCGLRRYEFGQMYHILPENLLND